MDIVKFFRELVNRWNNERKCNFCWVFKAPLSESGMNSSISEEDRECCVYLFLTNISTQHGYKKAENGIFKSLEWCDFIFTLHAVKQSNIGINVYNEIPNHSIDESLWQTILQPINNCLGCGNELELCEMGYNFEITKWQMNTTILGQDDNYTGWEINGIFRQYK